MELRVLGTTGVEVSALCLGTMMFGEWGNRDHDECVRIIHAALDAGINFLDTADAYSQGETETIVGKALAGVRREDVFLATKAHFPMGTGRNRSGNSRRWLLQAVDESLARLQTDWIDLFQIHRPDPTCDWDDTLGALSDLIRAGKVRYVGGSNVPAFEVVEAQWVAERRGRERLVTEQSPYSILARGIEDELIPACLRHRMGVIAYSPLDGGWLARRPEEIRAGAPSHRAMFSPARWDLENAVNEAKLAAVGRLDELADAAGLSLAGLALGFALEHPGISSVIAGPRTLDQLTSSLELAEVRLDAALLDAIDGVVPPGVNLNPTERTFRPPSLADPALRRRC